MTLNRYYCHNCNSHPLYLSYVSNPESSHFDRQCCPHCGSAQVQELEEEDSDY